MPDTLSKSSMDVRCASRLLDLPSELRNIIYEYAIIDAQDIDITSEHEPGLLKACKKTRFECRQMYYARNTFNFTPSTRDDGALKPLENWLSQIGRANCGALQNITISLHSLSGSLIHDPSSTSDPWSSFVSHMNATGCSPHLRIRLMLHRDIFPNDTCFQQCVTVLGSKQQVLARVEKQRMVMLLMLKGYLALLRLRESDNWVLEQWEAEEFATGDFVGMIKEAAYSCDATWLWIHNQVVSVRPDFPSYNKVAEDIARFADYLKKLDP